MQKSLGQTLAVVGCRDHLAQPLEERSLSCVDGGLGGIEKLGGSQEILVRASFVRRIVVKCPAWSSNRSFASRQGVKASEQIGECRLMFHGDVGRHSVHLGSHKQGLTLVSRHGVVVGATFRREAVMFHEPKDLGVAVHSLYRPVLAKDADDPRRPVSQRQAPNATPGSVERRHVRYLDAVLLLHVLDDHLGAAYFCKDPSSQPIIRR